MKYDVGQVIFLVKGDFGVVPLYVVEEVSRKTAAGTITNYIVRCSEDKNETRDLQRLVEACSGSLFTSLTEMQKHMITSLSAVVAKKAEAAAERAKRWYDVEVGRTAALQSHEIDVVLPAEQSTKQKKKKSVIVPPPLPTHKVQDDDDDTHTVVDGGVEKEVKIVYKIDPEAAEEMKKHGIPIPH